VELPNLSDQQLIGLLADFSFLIDRQLECIIGTDGDIFPQQYAKIYTAMILPSVMETGAV
jgi:hypothetical protein